VVVPKVGAGRCGGCDQGESDAASNPGSLSPGSPETGGAEPGLAEIGVAGIVPVGDVPENGPAEIGAVGIGWTGRPAGIGTVPWKAGTSGAPPEVCAAAPAPLASGSKLGHACVDEIGRRGAGTVAGGGIGTGGGGTGTGRSEGR
jgi:hypothetical protein